MTASRGLPRGLVFAPLHLTSQSDLRLGEKGPSMISFDSHADHTVQPADSPSYELEPVLGHRAPQAGENFGESNTGREFSLPLVDRGKGAWLCLMGGFCLEVMVRGMFFHAVRPKAKSDVPQGSLSRSVSCKTTIPRMNRSSKMLQACP